jgi:hypothetical protein
MLDEYIERTSLQSIGLGSSRAEPDFLRFGRRVAVPLRRRRHASLYIMTEARHRLREGVVLHGAGPGPAQRGVEIARLLFVVDKVTGMLAMVRLVENLEGPARVAP